MGFGYVVVCGVKDYYVWMGLCIVEESNLWDAVV